MHIFFYLIVAGENDRQRDEKTMFSFLTGLIGLGLRLIPCSALACVVGPVAVKPCLPCTTVIVETPLALTLRSEKSQKPQPFKGRSVTLVPENREDVAVLALTEAVGTFARPFFMCPRRRPCFLSRFLRVCKEGFCEGSSIQGFHRSLGGF